MTQTVDSCNLEINKAWANLKDTWPRLLVLRIRMSLSWRLTAYFWLEWNRLVEFSWKVLLCRRYAARTSNYIMYLVLSFNQSKTYWVEFSRHVYFAILMCAYFATLKFCKKICCNLNHFNSVGFSSNTKCISSAMLLKHVLELVSPLYQWYNNFQSSKNTMMGVYVGSNIMWVRWNGDVIIAVALAI